MKRVAQLNKVGRGASLLVDIVLRVGFGVILVIVTLVGIVGILAICKYVFGG